MHLLPEESAALLKWNFNPQIRSQLEPHASSDAIATTTLTPTDLNWLVSHLNHAIVKKGCRDQVAIDLAERLEYVEQSRHGRLESWYR